MQLVKNLMLVLCLLVVNINMAQSVRHNNTKAIFGKGIQFNSADTSMSIKFHLRMQSLFSAQQSLASASQLQSSFIIRRFRLKFNGFALTPRLQYKVELGLTNRDISVSNEDGNGSGASRIILDAVLKYQFTDHWAVWIGQTKLPGNRERVISSANLQFVDRSLVNSKFNIDRDVGIQLHGKYSLGNFVIKPKIAWSMGEGRDITASNTGAYNYTARLELLPLGEFAGKGDYFLADLKREGKPKLALGITYNLNEKASRQQGQLGAYLYDSTGTGYVKNDLTAIMADLIFKYKGFSILTEYVNTTAADKIAGTIDADDSDKNYHTGSGINIQAGYVLKNNMEFAGRYTQITPDDINFSGIVETTEYTFVVSKYFSGHNLKLQSDISWIDVATASDPSIRFRFQLEMQF